MPKLTMALDLLCEKVDMTVGTFDLYRKRYEFNHLEILKINGIKYVTNLTERDIESLKNLIGRSKNKSKYSQRFIIEHYGYENQLKKLIEELRELEEVIIYHPEDEKHLKEEMADVLNLIEQITLFKKWRADVNNVKQWKIRRQIKRIETEKKNESNTTN